MLKDSFSTDRFNKLVQQAIPLIKNSDILSEFEASVVEASEGEMSPEDIFVLHATMTAASLCLTEMITYVASIYEAEEVDE